MQDRMGDLMIIPPAGVTLSSSHSMDEFTSSPLKKKDKVKKMKSSEKKEIKKRMKEEKEEEKFMIDFFVQVREMKNGLSFVQNTINTLDSGEKNTNELKSLLEETNQIIAQIRDQLLLIGKQNAKLGEDPYIRVLAEYNIRVNAFQAIKTKFFDLAREYEESQLKLKNKEKERLERRIKIVNPSASQREIEQGIAEGGEKIFTNVILQQKSTADARQALEFAESQRNQILDLEKSILELHQLFLDVAILVEEQGQLINSIEANVQRTVAYVEQANIDLRIAYKHAKSARKKMAIIIGGLVAGIAAGATGIALKLGLMGAI